MLTYQQWDLIADAYVPTLLLFSLLLASREALGREKSRDWNPLKSVFISILVVYLVYFIDISLNLWSRFGLDYSSHTAMALVSVIFLSNQGILLTVLSLVSLPLYVVLMLYQEYHSLTDVLTTAAVIGPLVAWIQGINLCGVRSLWYKEAD